MSFKLGRGVQKRFPKTVLYFATKYLIFSLSYFRSEPAVPDSGYRLTKSKKPKWLKSIRYFSPKGIQNRMHVRRTSLCYLYSEVRVSRKDRTRETAEIEPISRNDLRKIQLTAVYSCLFCPTDLCSLQPWERSLFHIYTDK